MPFIRFFLFYLALWRTSGEGKTSKKDVSVEMKGDILLAGLFPVHSTQMDECTSLNPERGVQRVEAMLYTLDEINNNENLLPGLTLGTSIRDTCSSAHRALEQSLHFIKSGLSQCSAFDNQTQGSVFRGVIGGSYSSVTTMVSNLLSLFGIPQISYASTSMALSNKRVYKYFARTVPSDLDQAKVMAKLVHNYGWNWVSTVRSEGDYGDSGMQAFNREAQNLNICIANSEVIRKQTTMEELDIIAEILTKPSNKARTVVLFLRIEDVEKLMDAVARTDSSAKLLWIASDGWGQEQRPIERNSRIARGALTIEIEAEQIEKFKDYYKNLSLKGSIRNPWFKELLEHNSKCKFENSTNKSNITPCLKKDELSEKWGHESKIQFIYEAVYAFAHTLNKQQSRLCFKNKTFEEFKNNFNKSDCISKLLNVSGEEFYNEMIQQKFNVDMNSKWKEVAFNNNGDVNGQYSIYNYHEDPNTGKFDYLKIGEYQNNNLKIYEHQRITWPDGTSDKDKIPQSSCSEPCVKGERRVYSKEQKCCWNCETCLKNQIVVNVTFCVSCNDSIGEWPDTTRTICKKNNPIYIKYDSGYAMIPMIFGGLGLICTSCVLVTFYRFRETPVVKACGREMTCFILSGCMVCYMMTFVLMVTPNRFSCTLQRLGVGLGLATMYGAMLTKINRLYRIFNAAKKTIKRPPLISPKSQLVICTSLVGLQVALTFFWYGFDAPDLNNKGDGKFYLRCKFNANSYLNSLMYNIMLIVICTFFAIKTRHIPENFNESKFIGFTMYTTFIIWLAFLAIYFTTSDSIQVTTLCIAMSLSATVTLVCLFAPKMYILLWQPEKNVRRLTMNSNTNTSKFKDLLSNSKNAVQANNDQKAKVLLSKTFQAIQRKQISSFDVNETHINNKTTTESIAEDSSYTREINPDLVKSLKNNHQSHGDVYLGQKKPLIKIETQTKNMCLHKKIEDLETKITSTPQTILRDRMMTGVNLVNPTPLLLDTLNKQLEPVRISDDTVTEDELNESDDSRIIRHDSADGFIVNKYTRINVNGKKTCLTAIQGELDDNDHDEPLYSMMIFNKFNSKKGENSGQCSSGKARNQDIKINPMCNSECCHEDSLCSLDSCSSYENDNQCCEVLSRNNYQPNVQIVQCEWKQLQIAYNRAGNIPLPRQRQVEESSTSDDLSILNTFQNPNAKEDKNRSDKKDYQKMITTV